LALVLAHDLLLSKRGIALPAKHGLNALVTRHKARLSAELTKARIRKGFASLDALREHINDTGVEAKADEADGKTKPFHPRWIRINTLRTTLEDQLSTTFANYSRVNNISELRSTSAKTLYVDEHIPNLLAIPALSNLNAGKAYRDGMLIFQDKASCFPAYLLDPLSANGDVLDGCAAPGNKTTHVAAILHRSQAVNTSKVYACEKDEMRSKTLEKMTKLADPKGIIHVKAKQNFLKLNPNSKELKDVTCILLDPSCSGSGIISRDEGGIVVHLPSITSEESNARRGKKRKRAVEPKPETDIEPIASPDDEMQEEEPETAATDDDSLAKRLVALSDFQLRLLEYAMTFPAAARITYSTCSIHKEENEVVIVRALSSEAVQAAGWRIMKRNEQVDGMQRWHLRGDVKAVEAAREDADSATKYDSEEVAQACIRCDKTGEDGTMGFFVAGFVRDSSSVTRPGVDKTQAQSETVQDGDIDEEEEWSGFGDD
jgi:putative methyltransferase